MTTQIKGNDTSTFGGAIDTTKVTTDVPAFRARLSANQSLSNNTLTKIQVDNETFDTLGEYDNATNYRYTPSVAGYYQVNGTIYFNGSGVTRGIVRIYKNGGEVGRTDFSNTGNDIIMNYSDIVYLNGSTDYLELYGYMSFSTSGQAVVSFTNFSAALMGAV